MGVVRNCIDIVGITPESELPFRKKGQHIETSQKENLVIDSKITIKNIYQIVMDIGIKGTRIVNSSPSKIVVIDGYKKFKVACYDMDNNMAVIELYSPFNLFFDSGNSDAKLEKPNIYIVDAYFELINSKKLYCNIVYLIDTHYFEDITPVEKKRNINKYSREDLNGKLYTSEEESRNRRLKEAIINEMSISEDYKIDFNEENDFNITEKTELIDIEAEYL